MVSFPLKQFTMKLLMTGIAQEVEWLPHDRKVGSLNLPNINMKVTLIKQQSP